MRPDSAHPRPGSVGILPTGALGAAFFYHLTGGLVRVDGSVRFFPRPELPGPEPEAPLIAASPEATPVRPPAALALLPHLADCATTDLLPEIVMVVTQTDQLLATLSDYVRALEIVYARHGAAGLAARAPILVPCCNGIFHQRARHFLGELIEESRLFGKLPPATDDGFDPLGRLVRGVTIQTGRRTGDGAASIHFPGPIGPTRLCGGDDASRRRATTVLNAHGGRFVCEDTTPPTRVEFDKALVNLCGNLLGQLRSIDDEGHFRPLKVREIFPTAECDETRELVARVVEVGRAVGAYTPDESFETLYRAAMTAARGPLEHVPSSIAWVGDQLRRGTLAPRLSPTETWLLDPLVHFARTAGLTDAEAYLLGLTRRVEARLALAADRARTSR